MASMKAAMQYPVYISLEELQCLIIGFGKVGQRKLENLLPAKPAKILILDKLSQNEISLAGKNLIKESFVKYEKRSWVKNDILKSALVFACTSDFEENKKICEICKENMKLCNSVTEPENGNFFVPAVARSGFLSAALSTSGGSPLLAAKLKSQVSDLLIENSILADFMFKIREIVTGSPGDAASHKKIFLKIVDSAFTQMLIKQDYVQCENWINNNFSENLACQLRKILGEIKK